MQEGTLGMENGQFPVEPFLLLCEFAAQSSNSNSEVSVPAQLFNLRVRQSEDLAVQSANQQSMASHLSFS